jgi:hypothetical protein
LVPEVCLSHLYVFTLATLFLSFGGLGLHVTRHEHIATLTRVPTACYYFTLAYNYGFRLMASTLSEWLDFLSSVESCGASVLAWPLADLCLDTGMLLTSSAPPFVS